MTHAHVSLIFFQDSLNNFEKKINVIQGDIEKNHKTIEEIKDAVRKLSNGDKKSVNRLKVSRGQKFHSSARNYE